MLSRLITFLSLSIVLLVPWQARYIVEPTMLGGVSWEYTTHSLYAVEVLAWVLFYLYFFQLVKTRHVAEPSLFLPIKRRHRLVVVSAIVVVLSAVLWASQDRQLAWVYLFRLLESFCLLLILATEVRRRPDMFLGVFWLSGVGQGILALVQFGVQKVFSWAWSGIAPQEASRLGMFVIEVGGERWLRAYGSFGSPAQLGSFLAGALVVGALIIVVFDSKKYEKWIVLGQAVVTLGLLVSFARSAWAAALLALGALGVGVYQKKDQLTTQRYYRQLACVGVIIVLGSMFVWPLVVTRLTGTGRLENRSFVERTSQYAKAWEMFTSAPALGVGPGASTRLAFERTGSLSTSQPVHNTLALLAVEGGLALVGLVLVGLGGLIRVVAHHNPLGLACIVVVLAGYMTEHFWWTLGSGAIMSAVIFSLSIAKKE
jgi:O-antigen ligase